MARVTEFFFFSTLTGKRNCALFYEHACMATSSFSNINFTNTLNSGIQYCGKLCGNYWLCIYLPKTRTSTERCDVKLCLFLAVHVYVPSSALRCTVSINSVPLATLCLILVGSFTSPDNRAFSVVTFKRELSSAHSRYSII